MGGNYPRQRKTTLKWTSDGELSSVDKARILERLTNRELTECELACNMTIQNEVINNCEVEHDKTK